MGRWAEFLGWVAFFASCALLLLVVAYFCAAVTIGVCYGPLTVQGGC